MHFHPINDAPTHEVAMSDWINITKHKEKDKIRYQTVIHANKAVVPAASFNLQVVSERGCRRDDLAEAVANWFSAPLHSPLMPDGFRWADSAANCS